MENVQATALLSLMIGIFTFFLGFFRLGFLDSVLSRALLRGFVLAVAVVVMIDMSDELLGLGQSLGQCGIPSSQCIITNSSDGFIQTASCTFGIQKMSDATTSNGEIQELSPFLHLYHIIQNLNKAHMLTSVMSIISISFLFGMRYIKKVYPAKKWLQLVPEILVLVAVSTFLTWIFRWDCQGLAILNKVETNTNGSSVSPIPTLPKIKHLMLSSALISMIGFVESIAVAKTYASKHDYVVSPNRELVAMGVGNIISSMFGCFPAFGSLGRSAVNNTAGAKTQLAGFFTSFFVLITTLFLLPFFEFLPKAVCSSIIVVAAFKLIELEDVHFILRLHAWNDLGLLLLTFCSTIFIGIETGTLISVGASLLLVVKHTTRTRLALLGQTTIIDQETGQIKKKFRSLHDHGHIERIEGCLVIRIEETMFFGNVGQLKDRLKRIEVHGDLGIHPGEDPLLRSDHSSSPSPALIPLRLDTTPPLASTQTSIPLLETVIFEMSAVVEMDASATQTMLEIVESYHAHNVTVCFVKLREGCMEVFERSGIKEMCQPFFFKKVIDALNYIQEQDPNIQEEAYRLFADDIDVSQQKPPIDARGARFLLPFRKRSPRPDQEDVVDFVSDSELETP